MASAKKAQGLVSVLHTFPVPYCKRLPAMQLAEEDAKVLISLPPEVEPAHVKDVADLKTRVKALEDESAANKDIIKRMLAGQKLRFKLARHKLLDDTRTFLLGRPLTDAERGATWNQTLETMSDLKGIPREAASLTKFGQGTEQYESGKAAHDFTLDVTAEAVTSAPQKGDLYRMLFKVVYNKDAEELLFPNPEVVV